MGALVVFGCLGMVEMGIVFVLLALELAVEGVGSSFDHRLDIEKRFLFHEVTAVFIMRIEIKLALLRLSTAIIILQLLLILRYV